MHRCGPVASLTAQSLQLAGPAGDLRPRGEALSELDGQLLLDLGATTTPTWRTASRVAEAAEAAGRHDEAAALYQRCLALDPRDAVAAFNRANCLRAAGRQVEAAHDYARAIKLDPGFVEAWFNLAGLMSERGRDRLGAPAPAARRSRSTPATPTRSSTSPRSSSTAGDLAEARRRWERYLELDADFGMGAHRRARHALRRAAAARAGAG